MFVFVAVVFGIAGLIHLYLWHRLVRGVTRPGRWRRADGAAIAGALVVLIARSAASGRADA